MRDQMNELDFVTALAPVATALADNTAQVCAIIDRKGYESLTYLIQAGTLADADATFAVTMDHGDAANLSDAAAVAAADLVGTLALAGFTFAADGKCRKVGYVGAKRYTRLTITPSNNTGAAPMSVTAIRGNPANRPTVNRRPDRPANAVRRRLRAGGAFLPAPGIPTMRAFADLLETVTPASSSDAERNLTALAAVKTALKITGSDYDALIGDLIPRISQLIVDHCRLAADAAAGKPTFARETLRATWHLELEGCRGPEIYLPWRLPLHTVDSVVEDGTTLSAGTDFVTVGARPPRLRRMSGDTPTDWSQNKLVVIWKAGFAATMSSNVDDAIEAAAIEQLRGMVFAADRDPLIRSESAPDIGSVSYTTPGGDTLGALTAPYLLPQVRDMLAKFRNPAP